MDGAADVQSGAFGFEFVGDRPEVDGGTAEAVEFGDDEGAAFAAGGERFAQTGSVSVAAGVALVGVDPVVGDSEAFEGCALRSQILARGAASGIANQDSVHEATIVLFGSAIRDRYAGRLNRTVGRPYSPGHDRVPGRFGVCCRAP